MNRISIIPVSSTQQLDILKPWLAEFDHVLPERLAGNWHVFEKDRRTLALTQQQQIAVLAPAINPNVATPRETHEIAQIVHAWSAITPGGLTINVPTGSHMHAHMEKLGFRPKSILYEAASP